MKSVIVREVVCLLACLAAVQVANGAELGDEIDCRAMNCFSFDGVSPVSEPQSPRKIDTTFKMFTRSSGEDGVSFKFPDEDEDSTQPRGKDELTVSNAEFDGAKLTFFLTHGFAGQGDSDWVTALKDGLLHAVDANVVVVDWSKGAGLGWEFWQWYDQAASNTPVVGKELAKFADLLVQNNGADASRMHAIGFGLGAHVVGVFGKNMPGLARITGLDPARPCFDVEGGDHRQLTRTDALLVDVVHTTHNVSGFTRLGFLFPVGHTDFFVNSERAVQPGCPRRPCESEGDGDCSDSVTEGETTDECGKSKYLDFHRCSQAFAHTVYISALRIDGTARSCEKYTGDLTPSREQHDGCVPFGLKVFDTEDRGSFELKTSDEPPFLQYDLEGS